MRRPAGRSGAPRPVSRPWLTATTAPSTRRRSRKRAAARATSSRCASGIGASGRHDHLASGRTASRSAALQVELHPGRGGDPDLDDAGRRGPGRAVRWTFCRDRPNSRGERRLRQPVVVVAAARDARAARSRPGRDRRAAWSLDRVGICSAVSRCEDAIVHPHAAPSTTPGSAPVATRASVRGKGLGQLDGRTLDNTIVRVLACHMSGQRPAGAPDDTTTPTPPPPG